MRQFEAAALYKLMARVMLSIKATIRGATNQLGTEADEGGALEGVGSRHREAAEPAEAGAILARLVVVMDNLAAHKVSGRARGHRCRQPPALCLPPYSPDLIHQAQSA
ncbi:MAG: hypothetical protein U1E17_12205 [Geminicoccaceae bacterium]